MGLHYENLDVETHQLMLEEVEMDGDTLYVSNYLNDAGREHLLWLPCPLPPLKH